VTVAAVGVETDGATVYVEEARASESVDVYITGTTTFTAGGVSITNLLGTPTTLTGATRTYHGKSILAPFCRCSFSPLYPCAATIVADASHVVYSGVVTPTGTDVGSGEVLSCAFDGKGGGSCVDKFWLVNQPSTSTFTRSYTGSALPWYTITVTGSLPTVKSDGMSIVERMAGWRIVLLGLVVGVFLGL
jgi:hypothetical protein